MFVFFIHPRDYVDGINYHDIERIKRMYGILAFKKWISIEWLTKRIAKMPYSRRNKILALLPPMVTGEVYSGKTGKTVGWIVTIPMTAKQMLQLSNGTTKQKEFLQKKLIKAVKISKKMGAKIVGLGAMIAPVTMGGKTLTGKVTGMGITNGNALTAVITTQGVKKAAKKAGINLNTSKIAIVGATGSVGKATSLLLSESLKDSKLLLISTTQKKLEDLKGKIEESNHTLEVAISKNISSIKDCDIVIVTTSAPEVIIKKKHLKNGTLIYDDTQPKNVSKEVADDPNFLVIDGSVMEVFNTYNTMDIGLQANNHMYACEAETWMLSEEQKFGDFAIGREVIEQAREIKKILPNYPIYLAPFRSLGKELTDSDFERIRRIKVQEVNSTISRR